MLAQNRKLTQLTIATGTALGGLTTCSHSTLGTLPPLLLLGLA